jgi:uncharacterized protein involved in exopolysaccharide biosynthesis
MDATPILYPRKFDRTEGPVVRWEVVPVVQQVPDVPFPVLRWNVAQEPVKLSPTVAIAGLTAALATGAIVYNQLGDEPEYQGELHLGLDPVAVSNNTNPATSQNTTEALQPSVIPPTVDLETQRLAVTSPRYLDAAIAQLQEQGIDLDYQSLVDGLEVSINPDQTLAIHYRDSDPERAHAVLDTLAKVYPVTSPACQDGACRSLQLVNAQIPELRHRISQLRAEIIQLHEQYGVNNLAAQVQTFGYRSREMEKQETALQTQLAEMQARYTHLQQRLALEPDQAIAHQLLQQDPRYQQAFQNYQATERELAEAMSRADTEADTLRTLHARHQTLLATLTSEAQQVLVRHLNRPDTNHADPLWHEPIFLEMLQQSVMTAHALTVLELRQHTIDSIQRSLEQQHTTLTQLMARYDSLRQELQSQTRILHEYLNRQQTYEAQVAETAFTWNVVTPPTLLNPPESEMVTALPAPAPVATINLLTDPASRTAAQTGIAALLGLGAAIAVLKKHQGPSYPQTSNNVTRYDQPEQPDFFIADISQAFAR